MPQSHFIKNALLGVAIGDALGVPVEFNPRSVLKQNPVTGMQGYGTHHQPPGTWSDDSSLTFCLAEMLCGEYDLQNLSRRFINWWKNGYWTPNGNVFDIGNTTWSAINNLEKGVSPVLAGENEESSNGNGSLMRILPLLFHIQHKDIGERFLFTKDISSLTHRHIRSSICCFIYLEFALALIKYNNKIEAYLQTRQLVTAFLYETTTCTEAELKLFNRVLETDIYELPETEIRSSGYVLHTLEAALWCILTTNNYKDAVLKAVNLGDDSDTTAAVTGGLAGLIYGWETIPEDWLNVLAKRNEIEDLSDRLNAKINL